MILNSLHCNSCLFCSHIIQYSTHWWKSHRININSYYTYIPSPVSGRCSDKELGPLQHNQILQVKLIDNKQIRMYYNGLCLRLPCRQPLFSMTAKCTGSLHHTYHLASRTTYQNICLKVTWKPWCVMSPDAKRFWYF